MSSITAVLNLHREGAMARPSYERRAAIQTARQAGIDARLMAILDRPDQATRELIEQFARQEPFDWEEVDYGDLAGSRNHAVARSQADYVGFLDADDLWCRVWLAACHAFAEQQGPKTICHPEFNLIFGAGERHFPHPDQLDRRVSLTSLRSENYWTALSFAHRSVYEAHPYLPNRIREGFGYEDWTWNCETIAHGYVHRVVPGTSHFIRYKESDSLRSQTNANSCLRSPGPLFLVP